MHQAADALQVLRSHAPGRGCFTRPPSEAAVVARIAQRS
jgi:hypothetical protein